MIEGSYNYFITTNFVPLLMSIRKLNVDLFFNLPIELSRFEVNLVQFEIFHCSDCQNHSESVEANNRGKSLSQVNTSLLCAQTRMKPSG